MKSLLSNKFLLFTVLGGIVVVGVVAWVLLSTTATVKAAVLNEDISAGTTITDTMVDEIDVPKDTPGEFVKTKNALVGQKAVNNLEANQLIYNSDLMTSVDSVRSENDEFIVTSILVPDERALGGLLTAGDTVDISFVPNTSDVSNLARALPDFGIDQSLGGGIYFVLSNVKLLDTTTAVSSEQGSNLAAVADTEQKSTTGSYYLISLSYNDYKKLRIAEQFGYIYLTLTPSQNESYAPMLEEMAKDIQGGLSDSAADPIKAKKSKKNDTPESVVSTPSDAPANSSTQQNSASSASAEKSGESTSSSSSASASASSASASAQE